MSALALTGLDGSNPLAFLAALGVLNALADRGGNPRLSWRASGWCPVVSDDALHDADGLIEVLDQDRKTWTDEPCLDLEYSKVTGKADPGKGRGRLVRDLKPTPEGFRAYLQALVQRSEPSRRRAVDFAAAFATETAQDNNGNTKPTALHLTSGQQEFLAMVATLQEKVTPADLREAVFGPWRYERLLPAMTLPRPTSAAHQARTGWPSAACRSSGWRPGAGRSPPRDAPAAGGAAASAGRSGTSP
jgi:hypothetical protein